MSLHVGLRRAEAVAGISGMLVAPERLQAEIRSRPPVLLIHGTEDDVVAIRSMSLAETALAGAGVASRRMCLRASPTASVKTDWPRPRRSRNASWAKDSRAEGV